jgi:hypothetical protein
MPLALLEEKQAMEPADLVIRAVLLPQEILVSSSCLVRVNTFIHSGTKDLPPTGQQLYGPSQNNGPQMSFECTRF